MTIATMSENQKESPSQTAAPAVAPDAATLAAALHPGEGVTEAPAGPAQAAEALHAPEVPQAQVAPAAQMAPEVRMAPELQMAPEAQTAQEPQEPPVPAGAPETAAALSPAGGPSPDVGAVPSAAGDGKRAEPSLAETAAALAELFPALFTPGAPRPIKLRIQADIQVRAPAAFTKKQLSIFLHRHTTGTAYIRALVAAQQRFDLDGQPAGEILPEHMEAARAELERRRQIVMQRREQGRSEGRAEGGSEGRSEGRPKNHPPGQGQPRGAPPQAAQSDAPPMEGAAPEGDVPRPSQATRPPRPPRPPRAPHAPHAPHAPQAPHAAREQRPVLSPDASAHERGPHGAGPRRPPGSGGQDRPGRMRQTDRTARPAHPTQPARPAHPERPHGNGRPARPDSGPVRSAHARPAHADSPAAPPEDPARRERLQLLRTFEGSPFTAANFCALKGLVLKDFEAQIELARREREERAHGGGR